MTIRALAYPHLQIFIFDTQITVIFGQLRNLFFVGIAPVFGCNDLLGQLAYLVCLVVKRLVLFGYALRVVFLYVEITVKRLLLVVYNFGSAIMRSVGDTKLPFYSLLAATICNLILDVLFTGVFGMGVAGVAWATVIANGVNAAIIVYFLTKESDPVKLTMEKWRVSMPVLKEMLKIGIPAGLQSMVFSVSNVFIQSAINSFGSDAIAGSAAALTFEGYCYYIVSAFCGATIAFAGQNYGAGLYDRCKRVFRICMLYSVVLCGASNLLVAWQGHACISLFSGDPEVLRYAFIRFHTVLVLQWMASSYEISGSYMRALGYSMTPMLLTIFGTCVLRLVWVHIFRSIDDSFHTLMTIYPITWVITGIMVVTAAFIVQRKAFSDQRTRELSIG